MTTKIGERRLIRKSKDGRMVIRTAEAPRFKGIDWTDEDQKRLADDLKKVYERASAKAAKGSTKKS